MPKLTNIIKFLTMNRASLLGYGFLTGGLAGLVTGFVNNDNKTACYSASSMIVGFYFLGLTGFGSDTYRTYKKTKGHIQEHKKLDKRFVDLNLGYYCTRQGVYIAAKEFGYLDDYRKSMKDKRIIIPNF